MKITPLEIRQKTFEKAFRGLDKDEVSAFLVSLSHQWERMLDENKDLKREREKLEREVQKLREVENTLFRTLKTAEDTGASVVEQANKTAELHLKETQINCDALLSDSKGQAKIIIEKAEVEARAIMEEMSAEVKDLEENYHIIENQRDNVISQLKMISGEVMSKVENAKFKESGIETHLKKVKQMLRETSERVSNHSDQSMNVIDAIQMKTTEITPAPEKEERLEGLPVAKNDNEAVRNNHITGDKPIMKTPTPIRTAPVKKKAPEKVSPAGEISFFDQLED